MVGSNMSADRFSLLGLSCATGQQPKVSQVTYAETDAEKWSPA